VSVFVAQHRGLLPTTRFSRMLGISRATAYRRPARASASELQVRDAIQRIALAWPSYGYRPILHELRHQHFTAGERLVRRLMREDNLLRLRRRRKHGPRYQPHGLATYPNMARGLVVDGIDQLWRADLTYIRLRSGFVFAAVLMDGYSRRSLGWAVGETLEGELALTALRMALRRRRPAPGLVHHSDRGVQYASHEYVALLREHGIRVSMSRAGNPYDNAACERLIKTLKHEEIYLREYDDLADARRRIGHFLDDIYNHKRRHSALGYLPPAEFERRLANTAEVGTPA
jgi:putative transposase